MDDAEDPIAVPDRVHLDSNRREVVDLREVLLLAGHLLPHRVDVLRPACDLSRNVDIVELAGQDLAQVRNQRFAIVALARDPLDYVLICLRLKVAEGKVLQLPFELADAKAVRQRSVDIQSLARDLATLP